MRFLVSFVILLSFSQSLSAQDDAQQARVMAQIVRERINLTNVSINSSSGLFAIKGPAGTLQGTPYLDTAWQAGNVIFYPKIGLSLKTDSLAGVPVRLDLMAGEIEVKAAANDIRVIKASAIRYADINNAFGSVSRFVNSQEYQLDGTTLQGFLEEVVPGKLSLLMHPTVHLQKSNYNVAMNVGTKDDRLIKKTDWYAAKDKQAVRFSPGRKALLDLMADKKEQITQFLKTTDPDLKSRKGLISIFVYYNSLY